MQNTFMNALISYDIELMRSVNKSDLHCHCGRSGKLKKSTPGQSIKQNSKDWKIVKIGIRIIFIQIIKILQQININYSNVHLNNCQMIISLWRV